MKKILNIIRRLRSPKGCPWDKKQTLKTLRRCLLEETHEVLEAIDLKDPQKINEELGDLLAVVASMLVIGEESKRYSTRSVVEGVYAKLIRRHPHVFGKVRARNAQHAHQFWDAVKATEKKQSEKSLLSGLGKGLPALLETYKIGKRVARVGFDWTRPAQVVSKIEEELREIKYEIRRRNQKKIREEIGDFLFSAAHLARHLKTDPEIALLEANRKFKRRFAHMEKEARKKGLNLGKMKLNQLEKLWQEAKVQVG